MNMYLWIQMSVVCTFQLNNFFSDSHTNMSFSILAANGWRLVMSIVLSLLCSIAPWNLLFNCISIHSFNLANSLIELRSIATILLIFVSWKICRYFQINCYPQSNPEAATESMSCNIYLFALSKSSENSFHQ